MPTPPGLQAYDSAATAAAARPVTRIAFITIGRSPRSDLVPELVAQIRHRVTYREFGVLDDVADADLPALAPPPGEPSLHTRLEDGREAVISYRFAIDGIHRLYDGLDPREFDLAVALTSGVSLDFEGPLPLLHGQSAVDTWIDALVLDNDRIGQILPMHRQMDEWIGRENFAPRHTFRHMAASDGGLEEAAHCLRHCEMIVMNSVGYTEAMQRQVAAVTGKPVVSLRRIFAGMIALLLTQQTRAPDPQTGLDPAVLQADLGRLTKREREVVMLVVNGLSNKEIGRALGISHRTVELHRAHGMGKLGVKSVSDLVRRLLVPVR